MTAAKHIKEQFVVFGDNVAKKREEIRNIGFRVVFGPKCVQFVWARVRNREKIISISSKCGANIQTHIHV